VPAPKNAKNPPSAAVVSAAFPMIFFAFTRIVFMISSHIPGRPTSLLGTPIKHPSHQKVASILTPSYLRIVQRDLQAQKKTRRISPPRHLKFRHFHFLTPVVIVVVPVTLFVPAPPVFIPPPVSVFPAPFSCLAELVSPVVRLSAVITVLFNRTIQLVIRMSQLSLAIVVCLRSGRPCHKHTCREYCCSANESHQAGFPSIGKHGLFAS